MTSQCSTVLGVLILNCSNHKQETYWPEDHQPWKNPVFAKSRLKLWGKPIDPPKKWNKSKYQRLSRIPDLIMGDSVLDVGCGCGHLYGLIKDRISAYTGLDFKSMVDICRGFFPNADWQEGNVYDLSGFGVYDTVVAIQLFIHLPDLIRPLRQCWGHASKSLLFTLRCVDVKSGISVNKKSGSLAHRYSGEELASVINLLRNVGNIELYLGRFKGRIMYIKLIREQGTHTRITPDLFNPEKIKMI